MKNLLATITKYKAKKAEAEKIMKEADALKNELIGYMKDNDAFSITCGQYVLTITECTRTGIDSGLLKSKYPEIAKETETVTTYERFTVR